MTNRNEMPTQQIKRDKIYGFAIVVGTVLMIVTMLFHPSGGDLRNDLDSLRSKASLNQWIHILAIASLCTQAFGFVGLAILCGVTRHRICAGLIAMVVGWISVFGAALASGIVSTGILEMYSHAELSERDALHVLWDFNGMMNHILAYVFIIAAMLGTFFWSWFFTSCTGNWKYIGWIGFVVAATGLITVLAGLMKIDVFHFTIFILGYSLWTISCGFELMRNPEAESPLSS